MKRAAVSASSAASSQPARNHLPVSGASAAPTARSRSVRWWRLPPRPGVRMQLTIWYTAIFGLLLLLAGVLVYANLENSLATSPDAELQFRAQQLADGRGSTRQPIGEPEIVEGAQFGCLQHDLKAFPAQQLVAL